MKFPDNNQKNAIFSVLYCLCFLVFQQLQENDKRMKDAEEEGGGGGLIFLLH